MVTARSITYLPIEGVIGDIIDIYLLCKIL